MADDYHSDPDRADPDRGYSYNNEVHDAIRSRTPADREADRKEREAQRQHDSQKGDKGVERTHGGTYRPSPELARPAGEQGQLYRVTVGLCVSGAAGHMDVAAYELPSQN